VRLVAIGLVAGLFSALFGVGGGIVIVPLLIIAVGLPERTAAAVSLGAIGITALAGTISYGVHGDLHPGYAALVGVPAAGGAALGAAVQQRLSIRALTYGFALLLASIGVWLLAG